MTPHPAKNSALLGPAILFACLGGLFALASFIVKIPSFHLTLAVVILAVLAILPKLKLESGRVLFIFLASYLSFAYFVWRTTHTISYHSPAGLIFAILLYVAELYGLALFALSNFVNIRPYHRKQVPLPEDRSLWPTVDVFIPTYNEDLSIVETTSLAAMMMDYPPEKLRVHVLDDGGTDARINHAKPEIAEGARRRRETFSAFCRKWGIVYIAREKNIHAKAGNLNAGLTNSSGELVLILDADHVPTRDFLTRTAGAFLKDPKLFLLQTPHFFANADPIEKNLRTFRDMPSENEMFYDGIQKGLDHWDGAYFCGSAALMRRRCLEEVGGFAGESITEDAETALTLHARGYHSAYIDRPMVCGLACESIPAFLQQRSRWGVGMLQIFLLKNPLFVRGLTLPQRLCYMSSCFFWFFPFSRAVFLFAPILFLLFGLKIYDTDARSFATFAVPHLFGVFMLNKYLFGRLRWTFVGDIYEIIQSIPLFPAMIGTVIRPRAPVFKVTAKGEKLEQDTLSPFARPYVFLFVVNVGALLFGAWRAATSDTLGATAITMFWSSINCLMLLACIGAMMERRQIREFARLPAKGEILLFQENRLFEGRLFDLSNGGAGLSLRHPLEGPLPRIGGEAVLRIRTREGDDFALHGTIRGGRVGRSTILAGFRFEPKDDSEKLAKIRLVFGDSQRWVDFQEMRRAHPRGVLSSLLYVVRVGGHSALEYFTRSLMAALGRKSGADQWTDLSEAGDSPQDLVERQRVYKSE